MKKQLVTASLFALSMAMLALPALTGKVVGKDLPGNSKVVLTAPADKAPSAAYAEEGRTAYYTDAYLRGTMNNWGVDENYRFFCFEDEMVDGNVRYIYLSGVNISEDDEFKIADESWEQIDWGSGGDSNYVFLGEEFPLLGDHNIIMGQDVENVDIRVDLYEGTLLIGYNLLSGSGTGQQEPEWVTVNVEKPGEFAETYLTQNDYNWGAASYVKVVGTINDIDLSAIKNLSKLARLDLSETEITSLPAEFMYNRTSLIEILLPSTLKSIGNSAFSGCTKLKNIDINGIEEIGYSVFYNCQSLEYINLTGVKTIGNYAFHSCSSLDGIDLSGVRALGGSAFEYCSKLSTADLSSALSIGYRTFYGCESLKTVSFNEQASMGSYAFSYTALEDVVIPEGVTSVGEHCFQDCIKLNSVSIPSTLGEISYGCFENCSSLSSVELKTGLKKIDSYAFRYCTALEEIVIPSTVNSIGYSAFDRTSIKSFKCYAVVPPAASDSFIGDGMDMSRTYLYVPPFSKDFYRNTQNWSNFFLMRSIEEQIDYIYVNRPLTINLEEEDNYVVANNPVMDLDWSDDNSNYVGQLTAVGEGTLSAGNLNISALLSSRYGNSYVRIPTLINYADKMRADNVSHTFSLRKSNGYYENEWYFISLPYDVKVSDIVPFNDTYWVIRRYDSAARADGELSSTWVNLTNSDVMEAGKGYIVSAAGGETYVDDWGYVNTENPRLTFTSGNSLTKNNIFRSTDAVVTLSEYPAEFAHNRSWNFVGNPYPSYFDMHCLGEDFTAPVTVWNGRAYVAYSPVDDDLVLAPYEAFFVQCPLNSTEIIFKEEGRLHHNDGKSAYKVAAAEKTAASVEGRNVFNFNLSGADMEDRARIVLNPEALADYEVGRDASKFFADSRSAAQIYVNRGLSYSIDERPLGDGMATLGLRLPTEGAFTLSLSGRYASEWRVWLTDRETGMTVNLAEEDYSFQSTGANDSRFVVRFEAVATGIEGVENVDALAQVTIADMNGIVVFEGAYGDFVAPETGVYVVTAEGVSHKVMIRK